MARDLTPENVLRQLEKGTLSPVYLFYGESEFRLEQLLNRIRETFIPESVRDFNLQIFYGDEARNRPGEIIDAARAFPFMSQNRLIIVRRTDAIPAQALEGFIHYLDRPMETTCLVFISQQPDFRKKFYKKAKDLGYAVHFKPLYDNQVVPWIMNTAKELGLKMGSGACAYLQQTVGNRLRDLYSELEKIRLYYGKGTVGLEEIEELAIHSRTHTIFELMDQVSMKQRSGAISVLRRYLEMEGKDAVLGIMGMLIRQFRLMWQAKPVLERGGRAADLAKELKVHQFAAKNLERQSKGWQVHELERAFDLLYQADGLVKSGSDVNLVLENVVLSLCD